MTPAKHIVRLLLWWACLAHLAGAQSAAEVSEYQVKAAFVFNFAKFVEWPPTSFKSGGDPFRVCVLGEDSFGGALQAALEGKTLRDHLSAITHVADAKEAGNCQIVFVSKSQKKNLRAVLSALHGPGILTVGESDGFAAEGGAIGFRVDDGKVHLEINLQAVGEQKLQVSSKLLSLAQIVKKP